MCIYLIENMINEDFGDTEYDIVITLLVVGIGKIQKHKKERVRSEWGTDDLVGTREKSQEGEA